MGSFPPHRCKLFVISGETAGQMVTLSPGSRRLIIGAAPADLPLPRSHARIAIEWPGGDRPHARFVDGDQPLHNDQPLEQPFQQLADGDIITIPGSPDLLISCRMTRGDGFTEEIVTEEVIEQPATEPLPREEANRRPPTQAMASPPAAEATSTEPSPTATDPKTAAGSRSRRKRLFAVAAIIVLVEVAIVLLLIGGGKRSRRAPVERRLAPILIELKPQNGEANQPVEILGHRIAPDTRLFFESHEAKVVERGRDRLVVSVPDIEERKDLAVYAVTGKRRSNTLFFRIEEPTSTVFHARRFETLCNGVEEIDLGPIPLLLTSNRQERESTIVSLKAATEALKANPMAKLALRQAASRCDVVVTAKGTAPLLVAFSVAPPLLECLGLPIDAGFRLAGYWMALLHDAVALGFGTGSPPLLPAASKAGKNLQGLKGQWPKGSPRLDIPLKKPPEGFAYFPGTYQGNLPRDKILFPEVAWRRVRIRFTLTLDAKMPPSGKAALAWVGALDPKGKSLTYQQIGTYRLEKTQIDPSNPNHLTATIVRRKKPVLLDLRLVQGDDGVRYLTGSYGPLEGIQLVSWTAQE